MGKRDNYRLGNLQLRIMQVLWQTKRASVSDVHDRLDGERLAYTTIATMLRKMESRGLVRHRVEGRRFIYEAAVSNDAVTRHMADDLVDRLFEGSLAGTVSHLLSTREVSTAELDQLERMIQRRKKQP